MNSRNLPVDFLSTMLARITEIRTRYRLSAIDPHLDACRALLQESDFIDVGVFGRFKAGKSSLLNALAGRAILPVGVIPVTTAITRMRYGAKERAIVVYSNGRTEEVGVESVSLYVSEAENLENSKRVASVTLELPSLKPFQGLQFVDTPGLESVLDYNTDTALGWLPKVGLALVAIGADPPLTKHDVALLRTLRSFTSKIAILLTKVDLLSDEERREIGGFIQDRLAKEFDCEFRVYPFSIRRGYEDLKDTLNRELLYPLLQNRDTARAEISRFKFDTLLRHTRDYLSLALAAAERVDSDRLRLRNQILDEKTSFESIRMELLALGRECAGQTRPWIMKRMAELQPDLEEHLQDDLRARLSQLKANLWNLSRSFEEWLSEAVTREMEEISQREGPLFCVPLEKALSTFTRVVQGFRDRLAGNIFRALGMRFDPEPFQVAVKNLRSPDISIGNLFMFNIDLLWFVIPMAVFRPGIERRLLTRIPKEVEKNLSRLASQWTESINVSILRIESEAVRTVKEQITTVESLLTRTQSDADGIRSAMREIDSQAAAVDS